MLAFNSNRVDFIPVLLKGNRKKRRPYLSSIAAGRAWRPTRPQVPDRSSRVCGSWSVETPKSQPSQQPSQRLNVLTADQVDSNVVT